MPRTGRRVEVGCVERGTVRNTVISEGNAPNREWTDGMDGRTGWTEVNLLPRTDTAGIRFCVRLIHRHETRVVSVRPANRWPLWPQLRDYSRLPGAFAHSLTHSLTAHVTLLHAWFVGSGLVASLSLLIPRSNVFFAVVVVVVLCLNSFSYRFVCFIYQLDAHIAAIFLLK